MLNLLEGKDFHGSSDKVFILSFVERLRESWKCIFILKSGKFVELKWKDCGGKGGKKLPPADHRQEKVENRAAADCGIVPGRAAAAVQPVRNHAEKTFNSDFNIVLKSLLNPVGSLWKSRRISLFPIYARLLSRMFLMISLTS